MGNGYQNRTSVAVFRDEPLGSTYSGAVTPWEQSDVTLTNVTISIYRQPNRLLLEQNPIEYLPLGYSYVNGARSRDFGQSHNFQI